MERKSTVSLCMIVKNEEKYLRQCLSSVKDIVDEMIIVDTGSTDATVEIAKEFDAKIIYYKWTEDFAEARNVSLEYAKMDWILIMDGDDIFEVKDHYKFINVIDNIPREVILFNTVSFSGVVENGEIINNLNVRLIKNNKKYKYEGAIHEQIVAVDSSKGNTTEKIAVPDINIYHYGYLAEVADGKNKSKRNMSILKSELAKDPENKFNLFNMGNEYFALAEYDKAFALYDNVYEKIEDTPGYLSKLMFRRIICLTMLGENLEAINAIDKDLETYPNFTDLVYQKAVIYEKQARYTKAIDMLNKCIEMGESPIQLSFLAGSGTYKAYETLGNIYYNLRDFEKAVEAYKNAYIFNSRKKLYLENIIKVLASYKSEENKDINIIENIKPLIKDNELQILNIFLNRGLIEEYTELNEAIDSEALNKNESLLLKARKLFYENKYIEALGYLTYLEEIKYKLFQVSKYKVLIFMFIFPDSLSSYLKRIEISDIEKDILVTSYRLLNNLEVMDFNKELNTEKLINLSTDILRDLLILKEFNMFEKLVNIFNYIIDNSVLLRLAKLYEDMGYNRQATQEVVRSIKIFNITDIECINILRRGI